MSQRIRKPDALEVRARELCQAAGLDPDGRIEYDAATGRTQPNWCSYRDLAREERNAANLAKAEAEARIMPQPDEYKDAPVTVYGDIEESAIGQMRTCMLVGNTVMGAICADGHQGYAQPVGAVIAYDKQISISGVGFDIGCGNMAIRLDTKYETIKDQTAYILDQIRRKVSFGVGRVNDERVEHELFDDTAAWDAADVKDLKELARSQLGTVGSGNHYVDLFRDADGFVWIGVHFGSRGLGHKSATKYLKAAGGQDGIMVPPAVVDEHSEIGERYLAAMHLAGRYAYAGREWVCDRVRQIIGGEVTFTVHNHHNFAWREGHFGKQLWVVRKGCTPAFPDQYGFIGGSMAEPAVIIKGREDSVQAPSLLFSTVHGAGRAMGRKAAKRAYTRGQMDEWLQRAGVMVAGGDVDESPMAYKRLADVLAYHDETLDIVHTLKPFAVAMAGEGEYDPYKD